MATSFVAYASQYLNRQQESSSLSSSQPLFYSFSTDEGSRAGNNIGSDLDDTDDPHLRASEVSRTSRRQDYDYHAEEEDDDPYLRLDEEDPLPGGSHYNSQSIPLIASHPGPSESPDSPKGWLAHQASPLRPSRSPSPSLSSSSYDSHEPPAGILRANSSKPSRVSPLPPPPPTRGHISLSLTESLLPRDGHNRPVDVFSLPDPRYVRRGRWKYNDSIWTAIWCTGVTLCCFFCILLLFLTHKPHRPPKVTLPYTTLLHTVPMLTILTFVSAAVAYAHIFLLRIFVRPVMVATSVFIPATLFISAVWAFTGSFMWEAGQEPTWGETVGLRLFSVVPLVLSLLTARRLLDLPYDIHTTSSILTLTTQLLIANPFLLALSPVILLISLVASIPFLTLISRLLLIGYFSHPTNSTWEWHVKGWANWAIVGTMVIWLWTWGVGRGVLRTTSAGVIGAWYFADPDLAPPPPTSTHTIHAALTRASQPSLGTVVLAAFLLTGVRMLALLTTLLRVVPSYLPLALRPWLQPLTIGAGMAVGMLDNATTALSKYALVYVGLTGDAFFVAARRAKALTAAVEGASEGKYKRKFRTEPPLTLLTVAPLTLTFPFALTTYLFVAHTLGAPDQALGASLLAGVVTALVGLFCVGLVKDTADTLYICYCIDKDTGDKRRVEVFAAFEYENHPQPTSHRPSPQPHRQGQQPRREHRPEPQQQRAQPVVLAQQVNPIDPFESASFDDPPHNVPQAQAPPQPASTSRQEVMGYSVSTEPESHDGYQEDEESQLFPGSDLF